MTNDELLARIKEKSQYFRGDWGADIGGELLRMAQKYPPPDNRALILAFAALCVVYASVVSVPVEDAK